MIIWESLGNPSPLLSFLKGFFRLFESTASSAPSDFTVGGCWIAPRTVATLALAVKQSNHSARSHLYSLPLAKVGILFA